MEYNQSVYCAEVFPFPVELINNKINPHTELELSSIKVFEIPGETVYEYLSRRVVCPDWYFLFFILLPSHSAQLSSPDEDVKINPQHSVSQHQLPTSHAGIESVD